MQRCARQACSAVRDNLGVTVGPATSDLVQQAREALKRHAWPEAYELFKKADAEGELPAPDLEAFSDAAWFNGQADEQMELQERAHRSYLAAGDKPRAAFLAFDLVRNYSFRGKPSIASAWASRGERILTGEPESYAHGYLAMVQRGAARAKGDIASAMEAGELALAIGTRTGYPDLLGWR